MTRKWNLNFPGALHFVTENVLDRIPVFTQGACCQAFIDNLTTLLSEWPCKLIEYVLMADHTHLIVNPKDGRTKEFTGKLKSLSAKAIVQAAPDIDFKQDPEGSFHVWQESFKAIPLWSAGMIWQKINYIHANPVKARLVASAKDYRWSSFRAFYLGSEEPLKVDQEWISCQVEPFPRKGKPSHFEPRKAKRRLDWRSFARVKFFHFLLPIRTDTTLQ